VNEASTGTRSTARAVLFGVLVAAAVALAYGLLSEPLELTLGLLAIALFGGWFIGHAIEYGAWSGRPHETYKPFQWLALALSIGAWVAALFFAFTMSQVFIPASSLPLVQRLTIDGFTTYLSGLEFVPVVHVVSLAVLAFMAWRGAR
jgi:hypothetical protein